jgi:ABA4-like protein
MSPNHIFSMANFVAVCCWLMLAALPRRKWVSSVVAGAVVPAFFAAVYAVIIGMTFSNAEGGFSSLPDVALLFSNPWLLLAGWIHYLAFDLLIGSWEVRDARDRGISHLLVVPCLILTFLFGPAGWLLYMGVRSVNRRSTQPQLQESIS